MQLLPQVCVRNAANARMDTAYAVRCLDCCHLAVSLGTQLLCYVVLNLDFSTALSSLHSFPAADIACAPTNCAGQG